MYLFYVQKNFDTYKFLIKHRQKPKLFRLKLKKKTLNVDVRLVLNFVSTKLKLNPKLETIVN